MKSSKGSNRVDLGRIGSFGSIGSRLKRNKNRIYTESQILKSQTTEPDGKQSSYSYI